MKTEQLRKKIIGIIICFIIIIGDAKLTPLYANATVNGQYEYVYDYNGQKIFTVKVDREGEIYFFGKHSKSTSTYTYHTTGFMMTLANTNKNPLSINNKLRISRKETKENIVVPEDVYSAKYTVDTYVLDSQDVTTNLVRLLKNQGYSTQGAYKKIAQGIDVYFSNIFEVVRRDGLVRVGTDEYYSYDDIDNAIYNLLGQHWSKETSNILKSYYDNVIHIRLSPFFYNVRYVDAKDYAKNGTNAKVLKQGPVNQEIFFGQYTGVEIPSKKELKINKKQYKIQSVEYVYETGQSNKVNPPAISGNIIEAYHGSKQNATMYVLLEQEKKSSITPTPKPDSKMKTEPTKKPQPTPSTPVPAISENTISYFEANPIGNINVQPLPKTGYDAKKGVPTTEKLYGSIQASEYLLNIVYEKKSGQITYPITVQKTYYVKTKNPPKKQEDSTKSTSTSTGNKSNKGKSTSNADTKGKTKDKNNGKEEDTYTITPETVTISGTITRNYSYTEIVSIDYYKIKNGTLTNQTLPGQTITLLPKNYSIPNLTYEHYTGQSQHLRKPDGIGSTIVLPSEEVSSIPRENLVAIGDSKIGEISVRNDSLTFGTTTVLSDTWSRKSASALNQGAISSPARTAQKVLYQDELWIEKTLANDTYPSSGTITYEKVVSYNSENEEQIIYPIDTVNEVNIHTPVYCKTMLAHDNSAYLQLNHPEESCIPLILDENDTIGDFRLQISNKGYHSDKPGYGEKDYAKYLAQMDGNAQNEVKFPVEMYEDVGNDGKSSNDRLIPSNTWTCIGTSEHRFYVPMWVAEGIYTVEVRSVAVNGSNHLMQTEDNRNAAVEHYVATDSFTIQTSGRLYGLTMYDVQDYPLWQEVFREKNGITLKENGAYTKQLNNKSVDLYKLADGVTKKGFQATKSYDYTVGINNSYGESFGRQTSYTMPLMRGAHPRYNNSGMLKTGYTMRFRVNTNGDVMGTDGSSIKVKPTFYYVDAKGENRREVDLYYQGTIQGKKYALIQVGSDADYQNVKSVTVGDPMQAIPQEEIVANAKICNMKKSQFSALSSELYSYDNIVVNDILRMYSNLGFAKANKSEVHTEEELQKLKQTYYFSYSLPDKVRAVEKGTDVTDYAKKNGINLKEDFWLKDGYLIVNFDIQAVDPDGNVRYSYINKENYIENHYCSMWLMEGGAVKKTDTNGLSIQFLAGDALIFSTNETASDDYSSDGIY